MRQSTRRTCRRSWSGQENKRTISRGRVFRRAHAVCVRNLRTSVCRSRIHGLDGQQYPRGCSSSAWFVPPRIPQFRRAPPFFQLRVEPALITSSRHATRLARAGPPQFHFVRRLRPGAVDDTVTRGKASPRKRGASGSGAVAGADRCGELSRGVCSGVAPVAGSDDGRTIRPVDAGPPATVRARSLSRFYRRCLHSKTHRRARRPV